MGKAKKRTKKAVARAATSGAAGRTASPAKGASSSSAAPAEAVHDVDAIEIDLHSLDGPAVDEHAARRAPRLPIDERVEIRGFFGASGETSHAVSNASLHGVFVETAQVLEVGDPVELSFPLDGGKRLRVHGRVRWVTPFGALKDARPGMGIELVGVDGERREALAAMLFTRARARR